MLCTAADILGHCWERTVEQRVAIVDGLRRITYRELLAQALEHNFSLRAAGLKKGDRVRIESPGGGGWGKPFNHEGHKGSQ